MLMLYKHALRKGVMAAALLGVTFAACNNDSDPAPQFRTKDFNLVKGVGTDSSAVIGRLRLTENADSSVTLNIQLANATKDTGHIVRLFTGTAAAPGQQYLADTLRGTSTGAYGKDLLKNVKTITVDGAERKFVYDSAVVFKTLARVQFSKSKDSVIAIGNVLQ